MLFRSYVPVCLSDLALTVKADAAKSWEFTVPPDLQNDGNGDNGDNGNNDNPGDGNDSPNDPNNPNNPNDPGQQDGLPTDPFPTFESFDAAFNAADMRAALNADGNLPCFASPGRG